MRANLKRDAKLKRVAALALAICGAVLLSGCETRQDAREAYRDAFGNSEWPAPTYYTVVVRKDDTLGAIAQRYDVSVDALRKANGIEVDDQIYAGEELHVPPTHGARAAVLREATNNRLPPDARVVVHNEPPIAQPQQRVAQQRPAPQISSTPQETHSGDTLASGFSMPVSGKIIVAFGSTGGGERNDGINIAANAGTPFRAAADGTVTYAGNELKGYGNLILIKHDGGYVTAYAHAASIGVARGQVVAKGDVIGTVGQTGDVDQPQLHFEIRRDMKPIDPRAVMTASKDS